MLKLICSMLFTGLMLISYSQGSWDIGYIPIDSINKTYVGWIVKIDFKTLVEDKSTSVRPIRSYVGTRDTGYLVIDTALAKVAERRKIYVDHGSYYDQYLECLNCQGSTLRIYDAEILEVDEQSILFRLETEVGKLDFEKPDKISKVIRILKVNLDGVMYKL